MPVWYPGIIKRQDDASTLITVYYKRGNYYKIHNCTQIQQHTQGVSLSSYEMVILITISKDAISIHCTMMKM